MGSCFSIILQTWHTLARAVKVAWQMARTIVSSQTLRVYAVIKETLSALKLQSTTELINYARAKWAMIFKLLSTLVPPPQDVLKQAKTCSCPNFLKWMGFQTIGAGLPISRALFANTEFTLRYLKATLYYQWRK